jgi:hypothetical protein
MTEINGGESLSGIEVLAFFTADHAVVENGKAYINGGFFQRFYHPSFPAQISIAVVALIRISPEEFLRDHTFVVEIEDADGNKLPDFRIEGTFRVAPSPDSRPGDPGQMSLAIPLSGVSLPRAGDYWFVLSIDGDEVARYEVRAAQVGVLAPSISQAPPGDGDDSQEEE